MVSRPLLLVVLCLALVHVVLAMALPLSGDEVYYWDCCRHLDWSYFDQPPLVPWLIVPFRALLGDTRLAVRAPAILASLLSGLLLGPLCRRLGGSDRQAAAVYLLLHAMPLYFLGSFYCSTDVVMAAAYLAATVAAVALAQGCRRAWWGFWLAIGLGFLAKMPVVLVIPALLPVLLRRRLRQQLNLRPVEALAPIVAGLLTAPVWIWGWQHDWDNLVFQLHGRHQAGGLTLTYLAELLAACLLLATPLLAAAMVGSGWAIRRKWRSEPWAVLLVATVMPLLLFGLISLSTRVGGHWCAPTLVLGIVLLVMVPFRGRRWLVIPGAVLGLALSLAVVTVAARPELLLGLHWSYGGRAHRINTKKIAAAIGNEQIAAAVARTRYEDELVASESYSTVHLLAFLSKGALPTRLAHVKPGKHGLASLYWHQPDRLAGCNLLFVTEKHQVDDPLRRLFGEVHELPPIEIRRHGELVRTVRLLRCRDLRAPKPAFSRL